MPTALPPEHEIRALVARIVDGVVGLPGAEPNATGAFAGTETSPGEGTVAIGAIAIGADHGGYRLKEFLAFRLKEAEHEVVDCGTHSEESVDYPRFAFDVARRVASGECTVGIAVDGAGIGSAMVANKVPGVRAAACWDLSSAINSREHNHANVLTLGAGMVGNALAWQIVETWLATPWGGGRHQRRVDQITEIERGRTEAGT